MKHVNVLTAEAFSMGRFEETYERLSDDVVWTIAGESVFRGKDEVVNNCRNVSDYFKSVDTDFRILGITYAIGKVVVQGTAEFHREGKRIAFVHACDVYEFNEQDKLISITSYCVQERSDGT